MAKYYISEGFSVEAGPQIGFLLSADQEGGEVSANAEDIVKDIDFLAALGASYTLKNGLNFSARYHFGLSDINDVAGPADANFNGVFLKINITKHTQFIKRRN